MPKLTLDHALQFVGFLQQAWAGGAPVVAAVVAAVKGALANHGIQADTDALDKVIAEAQADKAKEDALIDPPVAPV
jgi:hypothetical protein